MIDLATLASFALTSTLIEITPGPNMAYLALVAATKGRKPGLAAVAGVALGLGVLGVAAAFGLDALIAQSPVAYQVLRWCGVAYLAWLAWEAWREADDPAEQVDPTASLGQYFRRGLITNLLNPKAALFYLAVLPGFLAPDAGLGDTLTLSAVYVGVATAIHSAIVMAAGAAQGWLADPRRTRPVRRGLALALLAVAAWVVWKT
ncbi:LysE family translocator [Tabrizicola sp.]|uniref:LysE family translocator n=1 Tax=Tabrizicola sp. TaxID=2005166 RepID=UPI00286CE706|nr:LysE family translocator [Tabrizicola sp.]